MLVEITGELKIKKITIDPEMVDLEDIHELERSNPLAHKGGAGGVAQYPPVKAHQGIGGQQYLVSIRHRLALTG